MVRYVSEHHKGSNPLFQIDPKSEVTDHTKIKNKVSGFTNFKL